MTTRRADGRWRPAPPIVASALAAVAATLALVATATVADAQSTPPGTIPRTDTAATSQSSTAGLVVFILVLTVLAGGAAWVTWRAKVARDRQRSG